MKTFELDVIVRVRKTLVVTLGPGATVDHARDIMQATLNGGCIPISTFQKWLPATGHGNAQPMETVLDNAIEIVAVRSIDGEG